MCPNFKTLQWKPWVAPHSLMCASPLDNLILPFIMREGDLIVNNIPKMHCENPTIGDQCILFKDIYLRIIAQWDFFLLKF